MKLYSGEILSEEVYFAWKENAEDDTPGRMTAIVQTSQFIAFLEEDDGSSEDDSDEEE